MYELALGGQKGDSSATVYDELLDLSISENPSSLGTWSARIPFTRAHGDSLMVDAYVYYDGDIIFEGILEGVESSFDDSETTLSGRGSLLELEYQTDSISYSNTTVFDALQDYWTNHTPFDASVLPPNRDYLDDVRSSTARIRRLFNDDGLADHRNYEYHYAIEQSALFQQQINFTEDIETSASTIATDGSDTSSSEYSRQTAVRFDGSGGTYLDYAYSLPDQDYDNSNYTWNVRLQSSSVASATLDFYIDGTHVRTWSISSSTLSHQWVDVLSDSRLSTVNSAPSSINSDPTFRIEVSGLDSGEWIDFDAEAVTDETYGTYTLPSSTNSDGVYTGPEWYPQNVIADGESSNSVDIEPSTDVDRLGVVLETVEALPSFTAKLKNIDTGEVVSDTDSHVSEATKHYFDFQFSNGTGTEFALLLELDGQVPDTQTASGESSGPHVARFELFAPDESGFVTIDDTEFNGTKYEILKSLVERGKYRFAVIDYEADCVETFPRDTIGEQPFWTVKKEQRKLDYTDYANKITVDGKTLDDGTYNSATVSNQDEINVLGRTVHKYEKNPEVSTQAEVDDRAQRLLEERIAEKDESGSMDVVPQDIDVGYSYPIAPWGDAFKYGGQIGQNALNFRGSDGDPDHVYWDDAGAGPVTDSYTFEFLIHPRGLREMADNEYVGLCSLYNGDTTTSFHDLVTIYGDGSVGFGYGQQDNSDPYRVRSEPRLVNDRETQRLSVLFEDGSNNWKLYIDGELRETIDPPTSAVNAFELDTDGGEFRLGVDANKNNPFDGGIDDVRCFYETRSQAQIDQYAYEDLMESTSVDISALPFYLRFDDRSDTTTAVMESAAVYTPTDATIVGASYEASYGRLEEVQYSLGKEGNLSLDFNIAGRVDTELAKTRDEVRSNRRNL